jgi:hypothetical protein
MVDIQLNENIFIQPEGCFVMTGYRWYNPKNTVVGSVAGYNYRVNTMQIPVNVTWKFFHTGQSRLFLSGGPYASLNFGGTYSVDTVTAAGNESSSYVMGIGSDATDPQINRFDFGFTVSGGYEYFNGLFIRIFYQQGLLEMKPSNSVTIPHSTTYNYGFTIGYLLSSKE